MKSGKKKVISEAGIGRLKLPGFGQQLGIAIKLLGYDRVSVKCEDGHLRLCRIKGKMKRRVWIRVGDTVLVEPWDFQFKARGDIVWRYTRGQAEELRRRKLISF